MEKTTVHCMFKENRLGGISEYVMGITIDIYVYIGSRH